MNPTAVKRGSIALAVLSLLAALLYFDFGATAGASATEPLSIRWVIAHEPAALFDNPAKVFAAEFERLTGRKMDIEVLGPKTLDSTNGRVLTSQALSMLKDGRAHLATVTTPGIADIVPQSDVLALPFLFDDYDAALAAFESEVAEESLRRVSEATDATALEFTLSGGFVAIQSNKRFFTTPADFEGAKITTVNGEASRSILNMLGAEPQNRDLLHERNQEFNARIDEYDGMETTYTRLHVFPHTKAPKYITEVDYGLFSTMILVDDAFLGSLSNTEQDALKHAAHAAAQLEREDSIALGLENKEKLKERGTVVRSLTDDERSALKLLLDSLYAPYESSYGELR